MNVDETVRTVYTARIEQRDGDYVIRVPDREVDLGTLTAGESYRVAVLSHATPSEPGAPTEESSRPTPTPHDAGATTTPVEPGDTRRVEIDTLGEQGDGIARIDRGFVVIVPDTEIGERVEIEIVSTTDSVAFGEVTERISYYD